MSFHFFKNSYKWFNQLTKTKKVLHHINLTRLLQNPLFLRNDDEKLIHQCFRAENKQTLFWVGAHKYFLQDQTKVRKQILLQANIHCYEKENICVYIYRYIHCNEEENISIYICNIIHVMILEYTIYVTQGTLMWRVIGVKKKFASIQPLGSVNFVLFFNCNIWLMKL